MEKVIEESERMRERRKERESERARARTNQRTAGVQICSFSRAKRLASVVDTVYLCKQ